MEVVGQTRHRKGRREQKMMGGRISKEETLK
jgi:hypothetical protein